MKVTLSVVLLLCVLSFYVTAQHLNRCGSKDYSHEEAKRNEGFFQTHAERLFQKHKTRSGPIEIYVHWHTIMSTSGEGAVSSTAIDQQISVLNAAFEPDFHFTLSSTDVTTNDVCFVMGIFSTAENNCKTALKKGSSTDLNIYTVKSDGQTLGWAMFPWEYLHQPNLDGIVLMYDTLPGSALAQYNLGKTGTHEVGHWLGLYHTFASGCTLEGDYVDDTPAGKNASYVCQSRDSCTTYEGMDPINNFMEYTPDACMTEFTAGQRKRMLQMWYMYRYYTCGDLVCDYPTENITTCPHDCLQTYVAYLVSYEYIDISATVGTIVSYTPGDDTFSAAYTLPFNFPFFDGSYTTFYIGSNGLITLGESGQDDLSSQNWCPENDADSLAFPPTIAVHWDDLLPSGDIRYRSYTSCPGVQLQGRECVVIDYGTVPYYDGGSAGTFQVVLASDGKIQMNYESIGDFSASTATIGIIKNGLFDLLNCRSTSSYFIDMRSILYDRDLWSVCGDSICNTKENTTTCSHDCSMNCDPGYYNNGGTCTICPTGTCSPGGQSDCTPCTPGTSGDSGATTAASGGSVTTTSESGNSVTTTDESSNSGITTTDGSSNSGITTTSGSVDPGVTTDGSGGSGKLTGRSFLSSANGNLSFAGKHVLIYIVFFCFILFV